MTLPIVEKFVTNRALKFIDSSFSLKINEMSHYLFTAENIEIFIQNQVEYIKIKLERKN